MNEQINSAVRHFRENGFCAYESILSEIEQRHIRETLDAQWKKQSGATLEGGFGVGIHPLLPVAPSLAQYFANQLVVETLRELLEDDVRLVHAGARVSSEASAPRISWHEHYGWDQSKVPGRSKPERILIGYYVDGTLPENGPLVVLPRCVDDPIGAPRGDSLEAWPGEVEVLLPPGSVAIFDTALWHAAKAGTQPGLRRLFGAHYQGWSETRAHGEDNACDSPEVLAETRDNVRFRSLVERQ